MPKLSTFEPWKQTRQLLVDNLVKNAEVLASAAGDSAAFKQAQENTKTIQDKIDVHVRLGLRQINKSIVDTKLLSELGAAAQRARKETDRIVNATKSITRLTKLVDQLTTLVTNLAGMVK